MHITVLWWQSRITRERSSVTSEAIVIHLETCTSCQLYLRFYRSLKPRRPPPKDQCWLNPHRVCSVSDSIATYFVSWSFVASASHITARGCLKHTRSKFRKANCDLFYHCLLLIFKTFSRWLIRFLYFLIPVTWQNVQPITFFSFATKTLLTGRLTFPPPTWHEGKTMYSIAQHVRVCARASAICTIYANIMMNNKPG